MAGGGTTTSNDSSGRRSVDHALNMVPFIDLLSVLITFLLMTSVWSQVARIETQTTEASASGGEPLAEPGLELTVQIGAQGYAVLTEGKVKRTVDKRGGDFDVDGLREALRAMQTQHPANKALVVASDDGTAYREVIQVMDLALAEKLSALSVAGSGD